MNVPLKKLNFYYYGLILFLIFYLLIQYPRIYGIEEFHVIWVANSLREGALISENSWLISPFSYFGLYPYSNVPIGIPMILAGLISLLDFFSLGSLGISEAILIFNVIIFLIIYKFSKNLADTLFKEEWSRFIFVAAILLSPNVIKSNIMTLNTDLMIMILTIILLDLNLKLLNRSIRIYRALIYICLSLLIGALSSTIWIITTISIILMVFTLFIQKFKSLQYVSLFFILPISVLGFFFGLELFKGSINISINSIFSIPFFFLLEVGIISIIFPFGVIILMNKLIRSFNNNSKIKTTNKSVQNFINNYYYLLLFTIPFSFLIVNIQYLIYIILPIVIAFSVKELTYIKAYIPNLTEIIRINLSFISNKKPRCIDKAQIGILERIVFFKKIMKIDFSHSSLNPYNWGKKIWIILFSISIITFSFGIEEIGRISANNSSYPWENQHLTEEEIEIIDFFQDININGLIFVSDPSISARLGGFGFLPTFCDQTNFGKSLYYKFISPEEVHNSTKFLLKFDYTIRVFNYTGEEPILKVRNSIKIFDLEVGEDYDGFLRYNIQYIITIKFKFQPGGVNKWTLINSLNSSNLIFSNQPVFETDHLLVWKIY